MLQRSPSSGRRETPRRERAGYGRVGASTEPVFRKTGDDERDEGQHDVRHASTEPVFRKTGDWRPGTASTSRRTCFNGARLQEDGRRPEIQGGGLRGLDASTEPVFRKTGDVPVAVRRGGEARASTEPVFRKTGDHRREPVSHARRAASTEPVFRKTGDRGRADRLAGGDEASTEPVFRKTGDRAPSQVIRRVVQQLQLSPSSGRRETGREEVDQTADERASMEPVLRKTGDWRNVS